MSVVRSAFDSLRGACRVIRHVLGRAKMLRRNASRQTLDAIGLFAVAAELLVKQQRRQTIEP